MSQRDEIQQYLTESLHAVPVQRQISKQVCLSYINPACNECFAFYYTLSSPRHDFRNNACREILTFRCDPLLSGSLRLQEGFSSPVGIRSKRDEWITVILNESVENNMLFSLLEMALSLVSLNCSNEIIHRDWLIPANPKYFDLFKAFQESKIIFWKQSSNVSVGDIVYLYVAAPYSAIMFRCRAVEVNIPRVNHRTNSTHAMRIELLHTYEQSDFPLSKLKEYQITTVRGPRGIPRELKNKLEHTANEDS